LPTISHELYYDSAALRERLTVGILRDHRPVVFLFGSGITAPEKPGSAGVLNTDAIVELIRSEFQADQKDAFDAALDYASNRYQAAFHHLLGRRSQEIANEIIKRAVWEARKKISNHDYKPSLTTTDQSCELLDSDLEGWSLNPSVQAIGKLAAFYPEHFGKQILTTNFDPLLEVSIEVNGGRQFRTVLHRDGDLSQTSAQGCHVIHLHGYWHGSDTLHTTRQLGQARPRLKSSLSYLLRETTLVVCGYGGWDDIFTETLMEVALDDGARPQILWTFRDAAPNPQRRLIELLTPGIDRGRVTLYSDINCHTFFPDLLNSWIATTPPPIVHKPTPASSRVRSHIETQDPDHRDSLTIDTRSNEDNPPLVEVCVGRERELEQLIGSDHKVCFVTGFGGHGKSTLSARYSLVAKEKGLFDKFIWLDCKEQSERFENRLISIITRESKGTLSGNDLARASIEDLTQHLMTIIAGSRYLFVFDNIDHYVDLDKNVLTSNADKFLKVFVATSNQNRVVFTCRPSVQYLGPDLLSLRLEGLSITSTEELFRKRGATATEEEIREAHSLTGGHAFWLDLLAVQAAKANQTEKLRHILERMKHRGEIPFAMLESIWPELHDNQKAVLRGMAETVKPETDVQIGEYLRFQMNFSRLNRALRSLRNQNLIVVRPSESGDAFELHPLVREFVQTKFAHKDRIAFIDAILSVYARLMQFYSPQPGGAPANSILHNWTENAEICISGAKYQEAFNCLSSVRDSFIASEFPGEFARVARELFRKVDWSEIISYKAFDGVFATFVQIVANLDRRDEVDSLLSQYAATVPSRDARYINYCKLRCYVYWAQQKYAQAIEWGTRGKELKERSNVDTDYDTALYLALAQRDSGAIDPALQ
jgi:SIR2-like domain/NB-ARC domain